MTDVIFHSDQSGGRQNQNRAHNSDDGGLRASLAGTYNRSPTSLTICTGGSVLMRRFGRCCPRKSVITLPLSTSPVDRA